MIEEDFFNDFFNKLSREIDNEEFISELKTLIQTKRLSKSKYHKLIEEA